MGLHSSKQIEREKIEHWTDLWFTDTKKYGYVEVSNLGNGYKKSYGANNIEEMVTDSTGVEERYISLNAFGFGSRREEDLKQLRNICIDIDQYKIKVSGIEDLDGLKEMSKKSEMHKKVMTVDEYEKSGKELDDLRPMTVEEGLDVVRGLIVAGEIPEPNLVLTSRGIQIFYSIQGGASTKIGWLYSYINDQFVSKTRDINSDPRAQDITGARRMPGSVNARNGSEVKWEIWCDEPYTLTELSRYCEPIKKLKTSKKKAKVYEFIDKDKKEKLKGIYEQNYIRVSDLENLIKIRKGDMTGMRNSLLYVYSFHYALYDQSFVNLERRMNSVFKRIYSKDSKKVSEREIEKTILSAYEGAVRYFSILKANGFKKFGRTRDGIIKPYTSKNLIKMFEVDEIEQQNMQDIVGEKEKLRRDMMRQRETRGSVSRAEYNKGRTLSKVEKIETLKKILADEPNLSNNKIGEKMGISGKYVGDLKKEI
ncbi:hypothetical protein LF817_19135 [Halobacillus sp. A1]|uniref:hypothetical protein n=1 Tax=Halobacillus sp. A1 TaxID=2880262 RepID=UPI0020A656D7|nr:hypothetical protein [Halobacillus sp. A1]MCP3033443.1 hypothetical protein [Halobacillus sp. A1]